MIIYLGTESTIMPVAVGIMLAPKKSTAQSSGTKKYGELTNLKIKTRQKAIIPKRNAYKGSDYSENDCQFDGA